MRVVILAGGRGTRLSEETEVLPKPMVEIGGRPMLWHIMRHYWHFGFDDFVILLGYKGDVIRRYFSDYRLNEGVFTIDFQADTEIMHESACEPWKVTLIETGLNTQTGGRLLRAKKYLSDSPFLLTYGDGLSNVDLHALINFHEEKKSAMSMTIVQPAGRFGVVKTGVDDIVEEFREKPLGDDMWINGGFFVCDPLIFNYIQDGDASVLEKSIMQTLVAKKKISAFKHSGFWTCVDTQRDLIRVNKQWEAGEAEWKIW